MKISCKLLLTTLLISAAIFAAGCPKRVSIADINRDPGRYRDKDIAVAGVVTDSYGVNIPGTPIRGGAYKIDDGTGTLWVITDENVPGKGAELGVKGRVTNAISFGGRSFGLGMMEKDRRFRKR